MEDMAKLFRKAFRHEGSGVHDDPEPGLRKILFATIDAYLKRSGFSGRSKYDFKTTWPRELKIGWTREKMYCNDGFCIDRIDYDRIKDHVGKTYSIKYQGVMFVVELYLDHERWGDIHRGTKRDPAIIALQEQEIIEMKMRQDYEDDQDKLKEDEKDE